MANRFQKSLEALEKTELPADVQTDSIEETNISANILSNINSNMVMNILDNIIAKEPQGKSVALYLSAEIDDIITKLAKANGISKSKLVDSTLRQVFLKQ